MEINMLLVSYIIFLIVSLIVGSMLGGIYLAVAIVLDVVLLLLLIYHHSSKYNYICPSCNKRFSITFFQDMFSLNNGKKGKYLRCPYCNQKNWIQEKIKGKLDKYKKAKYWVTTRENSSSILPLKIQTNYNLSNLL